MKYFFITAVALSVPALSVAYACAAARVQLEVGAEGDEPHYLMVAESLLRDGDLQLERDYAERRYAAFSRQDELLPHYRVRGKGGEIYSLHAVGLSLLVLPAYALFGYAGASFFMALLLALLVGQLRALIESCLGEGAPATAPALQVIFEIRIMRCHITDGILRSAGHRRAPQVGVDNDASRVDHPLE